MSEANETAKAEQPTADQPESDQSEPDQPESDQPESGQPESDKEATKRKFREALDAKHGRHGQDHIDLDPQQPGAHGPVNEKRTFRRKTG